MTLAYSPTQPYSLLLNGADLAHLYDLIDNHDRFCPDTCERCERIRKAAATPQLAALDEEGLVA